MTKSQKFAFIIPSLAPQASITYPLSLYESLVSKGYKCDLYYFDEKLDRISCPNAQKISFNEKIPWHTYDVVNTHGLIPDFYAFIHKPQQWRGRLISTLHGFFYSHFKEKMTALGALVLSFIWMLILARHDHYVVFTQYAKTQFPLLSKSKMRVIKSGIRPFTPQPIPIEDIKIFQTIKSEGKLILGAVSRIVESKGLEQLLPLLKQSPNLHLILVGNGPYQRKLENKAIEFAVRQQITFLGYRTEGRNYIPSFDIFVMPSRKETFGLTMLESACVGTPIICTRIPTFLEIFSSREVAFFDLDNCESLHEAIKEVIQLSKQKISACQEIFLKKYTLDRMVKDYLKLFLN